MKLIQKGNSKLSTDTYMFNIPANKEICGRECAGCFAIREQKRYPSTILARTGRYESSKQPTFAAVVRNELNGLPRLPKFFRVHASGDFYSQRYINDWVKIAKEFPTVTFYAYTKRMKAFDFKALSLLDNFVLINSMQYGKPNYGKADEAPEGTLICPAIRGTKNICGVSCTYCMTKDAQDKAPFFIKH